MRGQFIVLEGIDGSGTTTQAQRLAHRLQEKGREVVFTWEPSTGPIGILLRQQLSTSPPMDKHALALLFAADRVDHVQRTILPALEAGKTVISDRYILSSLAYQGLECGSPWVREINGMGKYYYPADLTFFLTIDPKVAQERIRVRKGVVERYDDLEIQERIAHAYERALEEHHGEGVVRLDATRSIEDLTEEMVRWVFGV